MKVTDSSWPIEHATWAQQGKCWDWGILRRFCAVIAIHSTVVLATCVHLVVARFMISEGKVCDWLTAAKVPWETSMWLGFTSAGPQPRRQCAVICTCARGKGVTTGDCPGSSQATLGSFQSDPDPDPDRTKPRVLDSSHGATDLSSFNTILNEGYSRRKMDGIAPVRVFL